MTEPSDPASGAVHADWSCRWCQSRAGVVVMDLGHQSAGDYFPRPTDPEPDPVYPLGMIQCSRCHLVQLETDPTSPEEARSVEPFALVAQARDAIERVAVSGMLLPPDGRVLVHHSPHGGASWAAEMSARGLREVDTGPADVVVDAFGMMHEADQYLAMRSRAEEVASGGVLLLQFHSIAAILRLGMWNALRHGHFAYYSAPVLVEMAAEFGLSAVGVWEFDLYGGTVLLAFARRRARSPEVDRLVFREIALGVLDPLIVSELQESARGSVSAIRQYVNECTAADMRVVGYGAASRSVALLAMAGICQRDLIGVADASSAKIGRCLPGARIPVISPDELVNLQPDRVLLFVPDLLHEVRAALPGIELGGGRWVLIDPRPVEVPRISVPMVSPRR